MIEARSPNHIPMSYMNYLTRVLGVGIYTEMDECLMGGGEGGRCPPPRPSSVNRTPWQPGDNDNTLLLPCIKTSHGQTVPERRWVGPLKLAQQEISS